MSGARVSIALPRAAGLAPQGAGARIAVEFLDADGVAGAAMIVDSPSGELIEGRGEGGTPAWGAATPTLELDASEGARAVRVTRGGVSELFPLADVALAHPRAPDAAQSFGAAGARWRLAVVSERFDDAAGFFAHAGSLHRFIAGEKPFGEAGIEFGIDALFWISDASTGLFGATDDRIASRVLHGDDATVKRFVERASVSPAKTLVLINSGERAGAGGFGRTRPSWTTITAADPERWEGVALHELGHAFGLADEYDVPHNLAEPTPLEPNITADADPARTAWAVMRTTSAPAPTSRSGGEAGHDPETVGTFQGARYRPLDRFRASPICRMRTTTHPFCPVCRAHIRAELTR